MMQTRRGCALIKGVAGIVGLAVVSAGGYHLATGKCPLGLFGHSKSASDKDLTSVSFQSEDGPSTGGCCSMSGTTLVATTEADCFADDSCHEAMLVGCEGVTAESCPMSGEKSAEQTASSAGK